MSIVKNRTPYVGKIFFKFEKYPHYSSGEDGMLNKIHTNLGFTKLVSRIIPKRNLDGPIVDQGKIDLINRWTWGKIGAHHVDKNSSHEFTLNNSFLTQNGEYIGDVKDGWRYYTNKMIVCREYPHGVGIVLKSYTPGNVLKNSIKDPYENYVTEQIENNNIFGYYGYTHRGGQTFKIGDRFFQEDYVPKKEDYTKEEWEKFKIKFQKSLDNAEDDLERNWMEESGISYVIPFKMRGPKVIETWVEAREAAINMSRYLS